MSETPTDIPARPSRSNLWRWLGIGLGLVVLAILGAIAFVASIDPNRYKTELIELAQSEGGLWLAIEGDLAWSFFPNLGLDVTEVAVDWQPPQDRPPLAAFKRLQLDVRVLPLILQQHLEVQGIRLDGATLELRRAADGVGNWESPVDSAAEPSPTATGSAPSLQLNELSIVDGSLSFADAADNSSVELSALNLHITDLAPNQPFPMRLSALLQNETAPPTQVELTGAAQTDTQWQQISLNDLQLTLQSEAIPALRVSGDVNFDRSADRLQIEQSNLQYSTTKDGPTLLALLSLTVENLTQDPRLNGTVRVEPQDMAALFELPGPLNLGMQATLSGSAVQLKLAPLALTLSDDVLHGEVAILTTPITTLTFKLSGDRFNLARFQPDKDAASTQPANTATREAEATEELLPLKALREIQWQGDIQIGTLLLKEGEAKNVAIRTHHRRGDLELRLTSTELLGGRFDWVNTLDTSTDNPTWKFNLDLADLDSHALPIELLKRMELDARLDLKGVLNAQGNSLQALLGSLTGNLALDGGQGKINTSALKQEAGAALQLAQRLGLGAGEGGAVNWPDVIDYRKFTGQLRLQGMGDQQATFALDNLNLEAKGAYEMVANRIDYTIDIKITDDPNLHTFGINDYLVNVPIPLRCQGSLDQSDGLCSLNRDSAEKILTAAITSQIKRKAKEKVQDAVGDRIGSFLDRLKGN